jgi:hypothetical protein
LRFIRTLASPPTDNPQCRHTRPEDQQNATDPPPPFFRRDVDVVARRASDCAQLPRRCLVAAPPDAADRNAPAIGIRVGRLVWPCSRCAAAGHRPSDERREDVMTAFANHAPADRTAQVRREVRPLSRTSAEGNRTAPPVERSAAPKQAAPANFGHGAIRVLQNARAPAQLSLLLRR